MKCSDIDDDHVIELARHWRAAECLVSRPGVVHALMDQGVPEKVALAKVQQMCERGLLDYGTSPYYAWPVG